MKWGEALRVPLNQDLRPLVSALQQAQVPARVTEVNGSQVLWVPEVLVEQVAAWYAAGVVLPEAASNALVSVTNKARRPWLTALKQVPMTSALLLISVLVALLTGMGTEPELLHWLTLQDFQVQGGYVYFVPLADSLAQGQWWRLFSSMFVHFWTPGLGPLHLLMNGLWLWVLGQRIEREQGSWVLLLLCVLFSVAASLTQYVESGPGIVGGLSGVLYGLLGYCWIFNKFSPRQEFRLPSGVVGLMLFWLLLCWSGVFGAWVSIANGAHIGGLLAGCLLGAVCGGLARRRRSLA